ncbi:MAG: hypothetical protein MJ230_01955 [bacterium]|nr:hypothetical protein [bacterium]
MINRISVENNKINNCYTARNNDKTDMSNPSFKGAILPILIQGVQACEQNPMINVAVIDMFSAILPRTFVESLTNWFAGFEAFRRESSGLIVNCMIPSVITLGIAKLLNGLIMPKKSNMASCWADSNMIEKFSKVYEASSSQNKVQDSIKTIIGNIEGFKGNKEIAFKDILTKEELNNYAKRLSNLTDGNASNKEIKKKIKEISDEIVSKTKVYENIKVNGGNNPAKANNVEDLLKNCTQFFKEYKKADGNITMTEFSNKSKKLVRTKSLLGLAVVLPLAASMQFINRWITEKTSGIKGAPIYKDYGKENSNKIDEKTKKKGLLKQKLISMGSMLTVGLLSMMKMPTMNLLEFKGIFPTMDQARLISTTTFMSRMAAADDKNELAEATVRDIATFLSLYFLGDYAAKATATIIQKKTGTKLLNDTKPLKGNENMVKKAWHWFKDVNLKSSKEVISKTEEELKIKGLKPSSEQKKIIEKELKKATGYRSACQVTNLGVSLTLLGLIIPIFLRKNTARKHAEDLKLAQSAVSSDRNKQEKATLVA